MTVIETLQRGIGATYLIEREIGRGGTATVYLATDTRHKRKVALKMLHPELAESIGRTRFLREIEVAARLTHPHILPLHDSGDADGLLYYVMPYVEGKRWRSGSFEKNSFPPRWHAGSRARSRVGSTMHTVRGFFTGTSSRETSSSWMSTPSSRISASIARFPTLGTPT